MRWKGFLIQKYTTDKDVRRGLRLREFELDVVRRDGFKSQDTDILSRQEKRWTDTTDLDDNLSEMLLSLVEQGEGKLNDVRDRNSYPLYIYQKCDV